MTEIKVFRFNPLEEHTYIVWDETGVAAIIDPAYNNAEEADEFFSFIKDNGIKPVVILLTHGHIDHICGVKECADRFGIPVYMSSEDEKTVRVFNPAAGELLGITADASFKRKDLADLQKITFGNTEVTVLTTPGHSPGSVCYHLAADKILFSGDTLFAGSIGRTDFPGSSLDSILENIRTKLIPLDGDTQVYPGHGPSTTIGQERMCNPFINGGPEYEQI